jgi:hypothetical protein
LLLVFLCGASAGAVTVRLALSNRASRGYSAAWREGGKEISLDRFRKELSLSPAQAKQMETILDDFFWVLPDASGPDGRGKGQWKGADSQHFE